MNVVVDTPIWSLALRRHKPRPVEAALVAELSNLIRESRALLVGPVRQELLSGIPDDGHFETVRSHLEPFDDCAIARDDYEEAARIYNVCRKRGVQGSHIDFLICAVAIRRDAAVFTTDRDFTRYAECAELILHKPQAR